MLLGVKMNKHSPELISHIERLTREGKSVRKIFAELGISKNTIQKYRNAYLDKNDIKCACGKPVKHVGWCWFRFDASPERKTFMDRWREHYHHKKAHAAMVQTFSWAWHNAPCHPHNLCWIEQRRQCKICNNNALIEHSGTEANYPTTCGSEWCERIYNFYYVEGRYKPPKVRACKNNGLKFEFFLSDYIRRFANEQARSQHSRSTGCPL